MKKTMQSMLIAALGTTALLAATPALAGETDNPRNVRFVVHGGLTYGGEKMASVDYTDGTSYDLRGGSLFQVGAGVLLQPSEQPFALQLTYNYHFDRADAKNGDAHFSRMPLEAIAYYTGVERWRFGAGPRFVQNAKVKVEFEGRKETVDFKNTTGLVLEAGYQLNDKLWLNGRLVKETYKTERYSLNGQAIAVAEETDGSHLGFFVTGVF